MELQCTNKQEFHSDGKECTSGENTLNWWRINQRLVNTGNE